MTAKWSMRWLTLCGLLLALGCRSAPLGPVVTTPLFPDAVIPGPPPVPGTTTSMKEPSHIPPVLSTATTPTRIASPGAQLPKADDFQVRNSSREVASDIVPPGASNSWQAGTPQPGSIRAPEIKPLLIAPPGPPAGPDGFAPAPIIPLPEARPVATKPIVITNLPELPLPLRDGTRIGRSSDYTWLAGELDYHGKAGYWTLRYADIGNDDEWGGKVMLLNDSKLRDFRAGDTVYIEGNLLAPRSAAGLEGMAFPPYRITSIRAIK